MKGHFLKGWWTTWSIQFMNTGHYTLHKHYRHAKEPSLTGSTPFLLYHSTGDAQKKIVNLYLYHRRRRPFVFTLTHRHRANNLSSSS